MLFSKMRVYDGESLARGRSPRALPAGVQGRGRRRRRHGRRLDPLRLQGAGGDLQPRHHRDRGRSGPSHVRAGAGDPARAAAGRRPRSATWSSSRRSLRRATPSSSATRSRRPISSPTTTTGRTCSTATSIMPTPGSRIRTSRIPDTGQLLNRELLNQELTKIEKPAGIANPKDFRNEVVKFALARPRPSSRPQPVLDQLREAPRGDRAADVQPGRGTAAGDQLRVEEGQRHRRRSTANSSSAWWRAATRSGRSGGWSSGT